MRSMPSPEPDRCEPPSGLAFDDPFAVESAGASAVQGSAVDAVRDPPDLDWQPL